MKKVWYKWPEGYIQSKSGISALPWYSILRSVAAFPFILVTFSLLYIFVLLGFGVSTAEDIRKAIF